MEKQSNLFAQEVTPQRKYSTEVQSPIYEPKNQKPHILTLCDKSKTAALIRQISGSTVTPEEKAFLLDAAQRHSVFHYERIADYYAHASKEMQELMEESALVIIDFEKAIECGYVKLCTEIKNQYLQDYGDE